MCVSVHVGERGTEIERERERVVPCLEQPACLFSETYPDTIRLRYNRPCLAINVLC